MEPAPAPEPGRVRGVVDHVVILDGTMSSLEPGQRSNASFLFLLMKEMGARANRRLYYEPGMQWEGWLRGLALLEGRGIAPQIQRAYGWLASGYREGDRIFLFGYSRGAYAVRSLAGVIDRVGLLKREHAHVITAIVASLRECGVSEPVIFATGLRSLRNVHHLCTPIQGRLDADRHVLRLLACLHPTPAVCGLPRDRAARFLAEQEPTGRGLYAAPVGWFDASGDGVFWVGIRSALICGERAWLYAGAGVVAGSVPHKEYQETSVKLRAMLGVLGAES